MSTYLLATIWLAVAALCVDLSRQAVKGARSKHDLPLWTLLFLAAAVLWRLGTLADASVELIAGLLVAAFALFGLFYNAAVAREAEAVARDERKSDICRALRAEIDAQVRQQESFDWNTAFEKTVDAFKHQKDFVLFVPQRQSDLVYGKVMDRIEVLDNQQIENVVRYYRLSDAITKLTTDLRNEDFKRLSADRKISIFKSFIEMEKTQVRYGLDALLSLGDLSAAERLDAFNKTDLARSDQAGAG